ncbi:penicillin-binding protein [Actinocorallia populi]|uniref:penicillin-binding protein n=1 Tax=Actinocorallia populi TaxID=2079200 RepID=UPI000D08D8E4|nr:penicillin-binding protein [Actinocorallia populi]
MLRLLAASVIAGVLVALVALPGIGSVSLTARDTADGFMNMDVVEITRDPAQQTVVYGSDGKTIATFFDEYRENTTLDKVTPLMQKAIIAIEDARFRQHGPLDLKGTIRALTRNASSGGAVEGGSTLTQQLAKNMLANNATTEEGFKEATAPTVSRKLRELRLAVQLEQTMSKDEILQDYLNIAYFGAGAYGVEAAAKRYFSKSAADLTLPEAAMLAGITKNPYSFDPTLYPDAALTRRNTVLNRMRDLNVITADEAEGAKATKLQLNEYKPKGGCESSRFPYFCAYVYYEMIGFFMGEEEPKSQEERQTRFEAARKKLLRGGYQIYTTLDPKVQRATDAAVKYATTPKSTKVNVNAAVQPGTGKILAISTSKKYGNGRGETTINLPADAAHGGSIYGVDAGSTFKTFTLLEALNQGLPISTSYTSPATTTIHGYEACPYPPAENGMAGGGSWTLSNASDSEAGTFNMKNATWLSVNTYYAQLEKTVGVCKSVKMAEKFGMKRTNGEPLMPTPSQVLGVNPIDVVHLSAAYAGIAARGKYCEPNVVTSVVDAKGAKVEIPAAKCEQVVDPQVADAATMILQGVLSGHGTGAGLGIGRPAAAKTGTCENYACAVFAGYTPDLAVATAYWDYRSGVQYPVTGVYGATIPGPVWQRTMTAALAGKPVLQFQQPTRDFGDVKNKKIPNVVGRHVDEGASLLGQSGFKVRVKHVRSDAPAATIVRMSPTGSAPEGSTVTLFMSNGHGGRPRR